MGVRAGTRGAKLMGIFQLLEYEVLCCSLMGSPILVVSDVLGNQWTFHLALICTVITSAGGGKWGSQGK